MFKINLNISQIGILFFYDVIFFILIMQDKEMNESLANTSGLSLDRVLRVLKHPSIVGKKFK